MNISSYDEGSALTSRYKFMFQKLVDKAAALNDITEVIGKPERHYRALLLCAFLSA